MLWCIGWRSRWKSSLARCWPIIWRASGWSRCWGGGLGEPAGGGGGCERGGDGGEVAAGTLVRGAVEVRSMILNRLVRLRETKPLAPVGLIAHLAQSNHLRSE